MLFHTTESMVGGNKIEDLLNFFNVCARHGNQLVTKRAQRVKEIAFQVIHLCCTVGLEVNGDRHLISGNDEEVGKLVS